MNNDVIYFVVIQKTSLISKLNYLYYIYYSQHFMKSRKVVQIYIITVIEY